MSFEPIEHEPDDYELDDEPARQPAGERLSVGERFKRYMAGRRDAGLGHRDPDTPETERLWLAVATTPDPETAREVNRSRPPVDSWIDEAPITDRQLDVLHAELDNRRVAQFNKAVVRKLVHSVELARAAAKEQQDEQDGDVRAVAAQSAMSDARLERLAGLAELPCTCRHPDCERYTSALTAEEARELIAEARRARAAVKYGTWVDGDDGMEWIPCVNGSLRVYGCRCPECSAALEVRDAKAGEQR